MSIVLQRELSPKVAKLHGAPELVDYVPPANTMEWMIAMGADDAFEAFSSRECAVFTVEERAGTFAGVLVAGR